MQQVKAQHTSSGSGYEIGQSLLIEEGCSLKQFPNKNSTSRKQWTFSTWLKLNNPDDNKNKYLITGNKVSTGIERDQNHTEIAYWDDGDGVQLFFNQRTNNEFAGNITYEGRLVDQSAWYHIHGIYDSPNANADDRFRLYLNGVRLQAIGGNSEISQNADSWMMFDGGTTNVGGDWFSSTREAKGYHAETHFIDGQTLGPEQFALTDSNGAYNPTPYTGTYGTTGFYLPFEASDIGADKSGNDNDFTPDGFTSESVVADSPTNNYSVWMPFPAWFTSANDLPNYSASNGNKSIQQSGAGEQGAYIESIQLSTGKFWRAWHIDTYESNGSYDYMYVGFASTGADYRLQDKGICVNNTSGVVKFWDGAAPNVNVPSLTYGQGDTIGFAVDLDAGIVGIYKNGSLEYTSDPSSWVPTSDAIVFGLEFYTPTATMKATISDEGAPDGYLPVCTQNLPDALVNPKKNFKAVTYSGNSGTQSITAGMQPAMTWIKGMTDNPNHRLTDSIRGATKSLSSNDTNPEATEPDGLISFNADGFSVGPEGGYNKQGESFVSWNFRGGDTVTNNDGSIPSEVSANKDMGFSVVKWTQNLQQLYTIGHGLGKIPDLIITKKLNDPQRWEVYSTPTGVDNGLVLNEAAASATMNTWGSFQPTDKLFMFTQTPGDYIAYCFTNTEMLQVGSYQGNNSVEGPFIPLPFKPAFFMVKRIDSDANWLVMDSARDEYNYVDKYLYPDNDFAESISPRCDFLSNGIKIITESIAMNNASGSYMYLAIAEQPFKHARGR